MVRLDSARPKVGLGRIHVYLGRCDVSDVRHYRDLIGGVTLQGLPGLKIARALQRAGDDLRDVDVEPGTYRERRSSPTGQMQLGLDVPAFDWIQAQVDLGLGVIRTPARRIRFGDRDALRAELDQSYRKASRWFSPLMALGWDRGGSRLSSTSSAPRIVTSRLCWRHRLIPSTHLIGSRGFVASCSGRLYQAVNSKIYEQT